MQGVLEGGVVWRGQMHGTGDVRFGKLKLMADHASPRAVVEVEKWRSGGEVERWRGGEVDCTVEEVEARAR